MNNKTTFKELQATEFYKFFNCTETGREQTDHITVINVKTGGYKEYINLSFHINDLDEIIEASLKLDRKWIGNVENLNPFAKDIAKSFVEVIAPQNEKEKVRALVNHLFELHGTKDEVIVIQPTNEPLAPPDMIIKKILEVFEGEHPEMPFLLMSSIYYFKNIVNKWSTVFQC
ncbi:MAG: hypothetical protein ACTSSH_03835 [Candidatus Heimdallarchaeota archaeon]